MLFLILLVMFLFVSFCIKPLIPIAIAGAPLVFWIWVVMQLHISDEYSMLVALIGYIVTIAGICIWKIKKTSLKNKTKDEE